MKNKTHIMNTEFVAGAGFEHCDLWIMNPARYQTAPPCGVYLPTFTSKETRNLIRAYLHPHGLHT